MMRRIKQLILIPILVMIVPALNGCDTGSIALFATPTPTATSTFTPTATPTDTPTNTPTFTPTLTPTPTSTSTPTPTPTPTPTLSAADVFAHVSPSVVFIQTLAGSGSGVLIEDGYIVTNAHVVWPFQEVRVVFSDGSEHLNVPVLNWDLLGDLAVIGPLQSSVAPIALMNGENLIIGSEVFLIGYPGEAEEFPQPTFTRGLISRLREWEAIEMTYFQTDALIAGGQSGGVLVSEEGNVIGISGLSFTEAGFGLVASAADVFPRVERLIAGEDVAGLGDRYLPLEEGELEYDFTLGNTWDASLYVVNEPVGTVLDIEAEGENDIVFALFDVVGNVLIYADDKESGVEKGSVVIHLDVPHFVVLGQFQDEPGDFQVRSNGKLIPYNDVDDGISVTVDQTLLASIDFPGDTDYFVIDLEAGDIIHLTVDSATIDPLLSVDYLGAGEEQVVFDDNSGGGSFGTSSELTYKAPHTGRYFLVVQDVFGDQKGGYFFTVATAPPGATPVAPPPTPLPTSTPAVTYVRHEDTRFSLAYPQHWITNVEPGSLFVTGPEDNEPIVIAIAFEDQDPEPAPVERLMEFYKMGLGAESSNYTPLSDEQVTIGDLPAAKHVFRLAAHPDFGNVDVTGVAIVTRRGNNIVILNGFVPDAASERQKAILDEIMTSLVVK